MEARSVISAGSCWRIGTGEDIMIKNQPWLRDVDNPYITTDSLSIENERVVSLMQTDTKEWDLEVIKDIFNARDQLHIINTRIEQELERDTLYWKHEQSGNYSVRSAYRLLQVQKGVWNVNANTDFWKNIWSIKGPPKVLHLIWRAATACLPTKSQLRMKHVQIDSACPVCNNGVESIYHALVQCEGAARCWHIVNQNIDTHTNMDFAQWLEGIVAGQSGDWKAKVITLCWSIWRARNDLVWNGKRWTSMRIVAKAWEFLSQWKEAQNRNFKVPIQPLVTGDGAVYWAKPRQNTVKITVDAAVFTDQGASGIGVIARDHAGDMLGARTRYFPEALNPSMVEAIAVKEALSWVKEKGWCSIVIESDCLPESQ